MATANRPPGWPDTENVNLEIAKRFESLRADLMDESVSADVINNHDASAQFARHFLTEIASEMSVAPYIAAADSGFVELFWKREPGSLVTIRFGLDGRISYGFVEPDQDKLSAMRDGVCSIKYFLDSEYAHLLSYINASNQYAGALRESVEVPGRDPIGISTADQAQRVFSISGMVGTALTISIGETVGSSGKDPRQPAERSKERVHSHLPG